MSFRRRAARSRSKSLFRSGFETLEPRCCPSASPGHAGFPAPKPAATPPVSITTVNHTLKVSDSNAGDTIALVDDGAGNVNVTITNGGNPVANGTGSGTGIRNVVVSATGGGDTVNYSVAGTRGATALTNSETVSIRATKGNNVVTLDLSGGVSGANVGVDVDTSGGENNVTETIGALTSVKLFSVVDGTGGGDTLDTSLTGNVTASKALLGVDGFGGGDTLGLHVKGDIAADSLLATQIAGGFKGGDKETFDFTGALDGKLFTSADGYGGNETITQNVTVNQGSTGKLFAFMHAGKGSTANMLGLNLTDNSGGAGSASTLKSVNAVIVQQPGDSVAHNVSANDTADVHVITQKHWWDFFVGWGWGF